MSESGAKQKGEKQISIVTKNMTEYAKYKVKIEPDINDHLLEVIKDILEQSEKLESYAGIRLDQLSRLKEEERALIQTRLKLAYEIFGGQI